jgi:hypothetical protein
MLFFFLKLGFSNGAYDLGSEPLDDVGEAGDAVTGFGTGFAAAFFSGLGVDFDTDLKNDLDSEIVGDRGDSGDRGDVANRSTAAIRLASEAGGNWRGVIGFFRFSGVASEFPVTDSRKNEANPGEFLFSIRA